MESATSAGGSSLTDEGEKLFDLFRKPHGRSRLRPGERAVVEQARIEELSAGGRTVTAYRWGTGQRPVLLVHGWESRASRFARIAARLRERGHSLVAFDAPGHGESAGETTNLLEYRDIIVELHRRHGDFEAVVAHSFGVTATFFAMADGVRAGRVAAISSVPDFNHLVESFCGRLRLEERLVDELRLRIELQLFPGEVDIWARSSVPRRAAEIAIPLLLIHDEDDERVDVRQATRIAEAFGDRARLITTGRYGHQRILGAPQVVDEIDQFIAAGAVSGATDQEVAAR